MKDTAMSRTARLSLLIAALAAGMPPALADDSPRQNTTAGGEEATGVAFTDSELLWALLDEVFLLRIELLEMRVERYDEQIETLQHELDRVSAELSRTAADRESAELQLADADRLLAGADLGEADRAYLEARREVSELDRTGALRASDERLESRRDTLVAALRDFEKQRRKLQSELAALRDDGDVG